MEEGGEGPDVVEAVTQTLTGSCLFKEDWWLLRRLAMVATGDKSEVDNDYLGLWNTTKEKFEKVKNYTFNNSDLVEKIKKKFKIDWLNITFEDLKKPLIGGIQERVWLMATNFTFSQQIPPFSSKQEEFWLKNIKEKNDKKEKFINNLSKISKNCNPVVDATFGIDGSTNIYEKDFKNFINSIYSLYKLIFTEMEKQLLINNFRFNVFQFGTEVEEEVKFDQISFSKLESKNIFNNITKMNSNESNIINFLEFLDSKIYNDSSDHPSRARPRAEGVARVSFLFINQFNQTENSSLIKLVKNLKEKDVKIIIFPLGGGVLNQTVDLKCLNTHLECGDRYIKNPLDPDKNFDVFFYQVELCKAPVTLTPNSTVVTMVTSKIRSRFFDIRTKTDEGITLKFEVTGKESNFSLLNFWVQLNTQGVPIYPNSAFNDKFFQIGLGVPTEIFLNSSQNKIFKMSLLTNSKIIDHNITITIHTGMPSNFTKCVEVPCKNGARCEDLEGGVNFTCHCTSGFEGKLCEEIKPFPTQSTITEQTTGIYSSTDQNQNQNQNGGPTTENNNNNNNNNNNLLTTQNNNNLLTTENNNNNNNNTNLLTTENNNNNNNNNNSLTTKSNEITSKSAKTESNLNKGSTVILNQPLVILACIIASFSIFLCI